MPFGSIPNFGNSGVGPYANTNVGVMPNYFQQGPSGKGKKWYQKWIKSMGGRGRYGGGREAFDLALEFAKGGGKKTGFLAESSNPMMTAAYNAGKDYMRATGQRESSAGGNAQAGLLATLAAGRAGANANSASLEWLNGLRGLGDLESVRLGQELGEEGNYRDYFLNKGQARTSAWLQNKGLNQNVSNTVMAGPGFGGNNSFKTDPDSSLNTMPENNYGRGQQPDGGPPGSMNAPPTEFQQDNPMNGPDLPGGTASGGYGRPAQNVSTTGVDPFSAFKAQLKAQRGVYPKPVMGRTV